MDEVYLYDFVHLYKSCHRSCSLRETSIIRVVGYCICPDYDVDKISTTLTPSASPTGLEDKVRPH